MTITSSLRFLYIFGGSGCLLCVMVPGTPWDDRSAISIKKDNYDHFFGKFCPTSDLLLHKLTQISKMLFIFPKNQA